jgi:hypothetical protein
LIAWPSCAQELLAPLFGVAALLRCRALGVRSYRVERAGPQGAAIAYALALALWPARRPADGTLARGATDFDRARRRPCWRCGGWRTSGSRAELMLPPPHAAATAASGALAQAMWAARRAARTR